MPLIKLRAVQDLIYLGTPVSAGEEFHATASQSLLFTAKRKAVFVKPQRNVLEATIVDASEPKKRRSYRRRDMQPESSE